MEIVKKEEKKQQRNKMYLSNKQDKKQTKLIDTDSNLVVTGGEGGG